MSTPKTVNPFDALRIVHKLLAVTGFGDLIDEPKNRYLGLAFKFYRRVAFFMVILSNVQYWTYVVQLWLRNEIIMMLKITAEAAPDISMIVKYLSIFLATKRLQELRAVMEGPYFRGRSATDEDFLAQNKKDTARLTHIMLGFLTLAFIPWTINPFILRMGNPNSELNKYHPFSIETWAGLCGGVAIQFFTFLWKGFGHYSVDIFISASYMQAIVQLKIINYNLKHIFDHKVPHGSRTFRYLDEIDNIWVEKFIFYIIKYERTLWYTNELTSIFNLSLSFQCFIQVGVICILIFCMTLIPVMTLDFFYFFFLYMVVIAQLYVCCYYGSQVKHQSEQILTSVYQSNWLDMSPRFRLVLLNAMTRWILPLQPTVMGIVPLSMRTFISVTKSAYSAFSVMKATRNKSIQ